MKKYKIRRKSPQAEFAGSLLQQNYGESIEHGILKWNVPKRSSEFIQIKNDYAYTTLKIENGVLPNIDNLHPKSRIRLMIKNTPGTRIAEIVTKIREKYPKVQDINNIEIPDGSIVQDGLNINKIDVGNSRDINFQNETITDYLIRHHSVDIEIIEKVCEINEKLNTQLKQSEFRRNIVWKPKQFDFSNMFSFGPGNSVDFEKLNGVVGLFAPNKSGKSNFLESLCFSIFDKSPRALKGDSAMNNKKNSFQSKFLFDINNNKFQIKRNATRKKGKDVVVKTDFSVTDSSDKRKSLNGERRSSTNHSIRNYVGDYESFVMTALIPQIDLHKGTNANLINMKQTERKTLLTKFLDLTVFQELYELARDEMKVVEVKLKEFNQRDFSKELANANIQLKLLNKKYKEEEKRKNEYEKLYKRINGEIKKLAGTVISIEIKNTDINSIHQSKTHAVNSIKHHERVIVELDKTISQLIDEFNKIKNEIKNIDIDIIEKYKVVMEIKKQREGVQHNIDKYKIKSTAIQEQLGDFSHLEFDNNCDYCLKNKAFVKTKTKTEDLGDNKNIINVFQTQIDSFDKMLNKAKNTTKKYNLFMSLNEQANEIYSKLSGTENKKIKIERELDKYKHELEQTKIDIELYHKNENAIIHNEKIKNEIKEWDTKLNVVENGINNITNELMNIYSNIKVNKNIKNQIEQEIEQVKELEKQYSAYKLYMNAVEKDGVPFDLIIKTIPVIQHEVNNILSQMVDFQINFEIDHIGKDIEPKIMYDEKTGWAIELISGMERFISSIAIRVALLSVSSLPRPNFLIIDEGFSNLDADNLNNLYMLFSYLRTQFDFVLIISHLDYVKDMVDAHIEIKKNGDFSKINY